MGYHFPLAIEAVINKPEPTYPANPASLTDLTLKPLIADAKIVSGTIAPAMHNRGINLMDSLKRFEREKELRESNRRKKVFDSFHLFILMYIFSVHLCLIWN